MQIDDAKRIRESFGDGPCTHPEFAKEYYLGSHTGDYVCKRCGRAFDKNEKDEIESSRPG
jgi:hypothetical protein